MKTRQRISFIEWQVGIRAELDARTTGSELMFVEAIRRKLKEVEEGRRV